MENISYVVVDPHNKEHVDFLYSVLIERLREPEINISHVEIPKYDDHTYFVRSYPYTYKLWYMIIYDGKFSGMWYMSRENEIGIYVSKKYRRKGIGDYTLNMIIKRFHDEVLIANINPNNCVSIKLFESYGFKFIQKTYELRNNI